MLANAAGMALMCVRPRPDPNPRPKPPVNRRHLVNSFQEKLQLVRLVPDGKGRAPELHRNGLNALPTKYQCSEFFFFLACPGPLCGFHFPLPSVAKLRSVSTYLPFAEQSDGSASATLQLIVR